MSAMEPLSRLIGISLKLSKEENFILEAELFINLYEELYEYFRQQYKNYFVLLKYTKEQENSMLETNFVRFIIADILLSEEYTIEGIAYYTETSVEIIQELYIGGCISPTVKLARKMIEIHRTVRRDVYQKVIKKINQQYLEVA